MRPPATAALAGAGLVVGFAVAQASGVRELGGAVLVASAVVCGRDWARRGGATRAAGLLTVMAGAFVGSHVVAATLGAWPSVVLAGAVAAGASWAVEGARQPAT